MINAIWFCNWESGYEVGKHGVLSITAFEYAGSMGAYPWFRVELENKVLEVNSMFVEEVVYEKEEK